MPQPNPSLGTRRNNPGILTKEIHLRFGEHTTGAGALGADQILNSADIFTPANGTAFALTQAFHNDGVARCLGVSLLKQVANGGYTVRITGVDQFSQTQTEDITWASTTAFGAALYHIFTRFAYLYLISVVKIASSGTPNAADRVRIGLSPVVAGFPGTIVNPQPNGAQLNQYRGIGLPIPLSAGTDTTGASSTLYTSEIRGTKVTELAATAGTSAPMTRGAGWFVDTAYNVMMIADADIPIAPSATTDGVRSYVLHFQTNRWE